MCQPFEATALRVESRIVASWLMFKAPFQMKRVIGFLSCWLKLSLGFSGRFGKSGLGTS